MSAIAGPDYSSSTPVTPSRRRGVVRLIPTYSSGVTGPYRSPTTSIGRVYVAVATCLLLALLLNARAVVHDSEAMSDGPMRTALLAIGQTALRFAEMTHLTWPRDQLDAALGHTRQPAVPPLLASGIGSSLGSGQTPVGHGSGKAPAVAGGAPSATPTVPPPTPTRDPITMPQVGIAHRGNPAHEGSTPGTRPVINKTPPGAAIRHHIPVVRHPVLAHPQTASQSPGAPLRLPTAARPLRLLVTGDSLPGYLGPQLINAASAIGPVLGFVDIHNGTGLTRPDFVDWSLVAQQQVAADNPDAVAVWIGGNDFQNMTLPNGAFFTAGTAAWTSEYQRRAAICMRIWARGGTRRVYWLSLPPARNAQWAADDVQINVALRRAAATVPGVEYLDILGPVTNHGRYAAFVTNAQGQPLLVREQDGVHLNVAGSAIVAREVLPTIVREWRLGQKALPPTPTARPTQPPAQPTRPASSINPAKGPIAVTITNAQSPLHPATVFHRGSPKLYCWVRNSTLPPGTGSITYRWMNDASHRVVDQFAVPRSSGVYTGAFDDAVDSTPGPYHCDILISARLVATARFTVTG